MSKFGFMVKIFHNFSFFGQIFQFLGGKNIKILILGQIFQYFRKK